MYEFIDDTPPPKLGRPKDPKKIGNYSFLHCPVLFLRHAFQVKYFLVFIPTKGNPAARPTKMCPECREVHNKNFDRHLNSHFDVTTKKGRQDKAKVKEQAALRTVQGVRDSNFELLPEKIRFAIQDPATRFGFTQFLDDVGVAFPKEVRNCTKCHINFLLKPAAHLNFFFFKDISLKRKIELPEQEKEEEEEEQVGTALAVLPPDKPWSE